MVRRQHKYLLDFEKPIYELEEKLEELRRLNVPEVDLSQDIAALTQKVDELRTSIYGSLTRWQRVQLARHPLRPYTLDYIRSLTRDYVELHGDRLYADDPAIVGGFGTLCLSEYGFRDLTALIVGHQKGRNTKTRRLRRFGMPNPEGYRKARRLMQLAAKFEKPVVCLLDTPGAYPGMEAEERGQAEAIARNLLEMARLPVPIVVVIIGEGASGGALGIGVGDRMLMLENAWYSVIAPESCSSILWRSWEYKEQAAHALKLTATDLVDAGIVDQIVPEPIGGAHLDPDATFGSVGRAIAEALAELEPWSGHELLGRRLARLDSIGEYAEAS